LHVFLTGDIQVGKSTIIRSFLSQSGLSADGFMTYWILGGGEDRRLYISPYSEDTSGCLKHLVTESDGHSMTSPTDMASVFDEFGTAILNNSGKRDLIVMDELGFMESKANIFQNAVMQHIDGDTLVLGVIKPKRTEFLDGIRNHPNVEVLEVTIDNREDVLAILMNREW